MNTPRSVQSSYRQRLQLGVVIALISFALVAGGWSLRLFSNAQLWLTNSYFVAEERSQQIVIIGIDDASLTRYGRSPVTWSRSVYAELVTVLAQARVIAFDLLFSEPTPDDGLFADTLREVRQSDNRTRIVLAASGAGAIKAPGDGSIGFDAGLRPVNILTRAADYVTYANTVADVDGTLRRQSSFIKIGEETHLSFPIAVYLAYLRIPAVAAFQVLTPDADGLMVTPERHLHTDANGLWLQNFFGAPRETFPMYSLRDVVEGNVPSETFNDKIVLIGLTGAVGVVDQYPVPSSRELMPGVEIQAHALETLLRDLDLYEQPAASQLMLIALLTLVASLLYTQMVWYGRILLLGALLFALFTAASVNFTLRYEIINLLYASLALAVPAVISLGVDTTMEINRRRRAEFLLESVVEIADQQLDVKKVMARIAQDVQRMMDVRGGAIWYFEGETPALHRFGDVPAALELICKAVIVEKKTVVQGTSIAVPLLWHGRLVGMIAAERNREKRIDRPFLEDLAQRLAPGLENIRLYGEAQRQTQTLEAVLYGSPSFNILLDEEFKVYRANEAFIQWRGGNVSHKRLFDLVPEITEETRQHFYEKQQFQEELRVASQTFSLYATYIQDYALWVVIMADITPMAELSRLKTQMIRMASHDLKNPLSIVLGYSDLLIMDAETLDETALRFIKAIRQSGAVMLQIIEDILNLEQLRSSDTPKEEVALDQLAYEVINRHTPELEGKKQELQTEIAPDLPFVRGRPTQLSQVMTNLVGNAIKYTPDGGKIEVRLYQNTPETLRFEVQDTGYGISKEAQAKLFTEFYRVKTKETAHIPGTGLGLSLVKSVVEAHDGRIWVESEPKVGSTFYVELPVVKEAAHVA